MAEVELGAEVGALEQLKSHRINYGHARWPADATIVTEARVNKRQFEGIFNLL